MIHKWMEELFDTLLYLGLVVGLLIFSVCYWKEAYRIRCAELVLEEFLNDISISGSMSSEELEELLERIRRIDTAYDVELAYTSYTLQPCYAQIPVECLDKYYMERNRRKEVTFREFEINVEEENAELLCYQTETNASIMAAEGEYLPLPREQENVVVEAVRMRQEAYEGERLITVCRVTSEAGSYYVEAEPEYAIKTGTVELEVVVEAEVHYVPIKVVCYPRLITCAEGHTVVNGKNVIEEWKQQGTIKCPYCAVIPERISCNEKLITKKSGTKLTREIWLKVVYLDGHTEIITSEHEEWQDDYDENYCGIQPVTIRYRGKEAVVTVISENEACNECGKMCNERCFSDYTDFPYCTDCMSKVLLFTGEVYEEERLIGYREIVAGLDRSKKVRWKAGDMVSVRVLKNKKKKTMLQRVIKRDGSGR